MPYSEWMQLSGDAPTIRDKFCDENYSCIAYVMLLLMTGPLVVADQDVARAGNSGTSR